MSNLSIKPLADRVVVEPAQAEEKTAFGIIIPDTAKEKPLTGKIVAAGNGKQDEPMTVKVGDVVYVNLMYLQSAELVEVEGSERIMVRDSDIAFTW